MINEKETISLQVFPNISLFIFYFSGDREGYRCSRLRRREMYLAPKGLNIFSTVGAPKIGVKKAKKLFLYWGVFKRKKRFLHSRVTNF